MLRGGVHKTPRLLFNLSEMGVKKWQASKSAAIHTPLPFRVGMIARESKSGNT